MTDRRSEALNAIREGVSALRAVFDATYRREIDEDKGCLEVFVKALPHPSWLSAMIPKELGDLAWDWLTRRLFWSK